MYVLAIFSYDEINHSEFALYLLFANLVFISYLVGKRGLKKFTFFKATFICNKLPKK